MAPTRGDAGADKFGRWVKPEDMAGSAGLFPRLIVEGLENRRSADGRQASVRTCFSRSH